MLNPRPWVAALAFAAGLAVSTSLSAQEGEDKVVARVDGEDVMHSELMEAVQALPPQYQANVAAILPTLLNRMIDLKLAGKAARAEGLAEDEEVKERVAQAEEQIIRDIYLQRTVEAGVTEEKLQESYEKHNAENPPKKEVHARHILLKTEEDAKAVIAELDGGADFATLAQERSTGPSAAQGGDLGYFVAEQMVPEFSKAAFELEPGKYSSEPVQTNFGYHVIYVEDSRLSEPPAREAVEAQLREQLSREIIEEAFAGLRSNAEIEILLTPEEGAATSGESE